MERTIVQAADCPAPHVAGIVAHDPVCGLRLGLEAGAERYVGDTHYAFCSVECAERFAADPLAYLGWDDG